MDAVDVVRAVVDPDATFERCDAAPIPHRIIRETTAGLERPTLA